MVSAYLRRSSPPFPRSPGFPFLFFFFSFSFKLLVIHIIIGWNTTPSILSSRYRILFVPAYMAFVLAHTIITLPNYRLTCSASGGSKVFFGAWPGTFLSQFEFRWPFLPGELLIVNWMTAIPIYTEIITDGVSIRPRAFAWTVLEG
jgi:hypothetical protein